MSTDRTSRGATAGTVTTVVIGAGHAGLAMSRRLTERYTFTDANGDPFTDASYELVLETLYRRGVATALQATEFPLP